MNQSETGAIAIGKEEWNKAVEVAPDFWVIATRHHPSGSKFNPEINNRCLIFRLKDQSAGGMPVLLVVNAVDHIALPEVMRIEKETGAPVRYLLSPGGGHSMHLPEWHDALPHAHVLVGPTRIPRLAAGKKLAGSPRFAAFDPVDPMPQFHGQIEFVNFDGLLGNREQITPMEGGKDTLFAMIMSLVKNPKPNDPIDELWLYHVPTRTIFGGENLGWQIAKREQAGMPFLFRMLIKPDQFYIFGTAVRGIADKDRVKANWQKILVWPAVNVFTYHDTIGTGQIGGGQAALRAAVEKVKQL